jgi:hypothetical protein
VGCLACTLSGVLLTTTLPAVLIGQYVPIALVGAALSPLAALTVAIRVFDVRAYSRWQAGQAKPLGVRMLRACSDGITWPLWWWRRAQV